MAKFKAPLLHRLSGYEIYLPPLRERREDIGPLLFHFAREELSAISEQHRLSPTDPHDKSWMPAQIVAQLVRYAWPGNIRQLRNVTRQLRIENRGQPQVASVSIICGGSREWIRSDPRKPRALKFAGVALGNATPAPPVR